MPELLAKADQADAGPLHYLWLLFCEATERRQHSKSGVAQTLSNQELRAWMRLRGILLTPFEVGVLDRLERAFMRFIADKVVAKNE
jgi:hypothetical protein